MSAVKEKKPGFLRRIFGGGKSKSYEEDWSDDELPAAALASRRRSEFPRPREKEHVDHRRKASLVPRSISYTDKRAVEIVVSGSPKANKTAREKRKASSTSDARCDDADDSENIDRTSDAVKIVESLKPKQQQQQLRPNKSKPPLSAKSSVSSIHGRTPSRKRMQRTNTSLSINVSQPLEYPCTPEVIIAYHKHKPFLTRMEESLIIELNEYECLIDSREIIGIIAKQTKLFEVEPQDLWEEFFAYVEDMPSYDEIINFDVWQEFRDAKYPY